MDGRSSSSRARLGHAAGEGACFSLARSVSTTSSSRSASVTRWKTPRCWTSSRSRSAGSSTSTSSTATAKVVKVAAFPALNGDPKWEASITSSSRRWTRDPEPVHDIDKPFLMAIEDVFSIKGRGTVVTGRVERQRRRRAKRKSRSSASATRKTTVTGVRCSASLLDEGRAGDNIGVLLRGIEKNDVERADPLQAGLRDAAPEIRGRGLRPEEGRGRSSRRSSPSPSRSSTCARRT